MKFSELIYTKAENILKERQQQAEALAELRRKEFIQKYPQLVDIENEMKAAALYVIRSIGASGEKVDISQIAQKNLEAQEKKRALMKEAGYPENYLEPAYTCGVCRDTGIYNGKLCQCHLNLLRELSVGELSCSPVLAKSTFDTFDLKYYSDVKEPSLGYSPRAIMGGSLEMLKTYAENFNSQSPSFFFCGGTGLGKTHLALAVFNKVTQKGFSVYYDSASKILKQLEKEHFGRSNGNLEEELEKCDLLIIDNLGAEFSTQFSIAAINELVDNFVLAGKPMIIISNYGAAELEEKYGQRLTSRLNSFEIISFFGEDIRQRLK